MSAPVERIVAVVFDGLRPDMIAGRMPVLDAFGAEGVIFEGARSVFPSVTRVATTAIGSGAWPAAHGIVGNSFHQPEIVAGQALDTSNFAHLGSARAAWGRVVGVPTLGERLAAEGRRMMVVHGGSAGSAYLLNPLADENGHRTVSLHGASHSLTPEAVLEAVARHGALPAPELPRLSTIAYAAEVALAALSDDEGPDVLVVWFPEPDTSYHYRELGSEATATAMAAADAAFGRILEAARSGPRGGRTAVLALSDHGQISTTGSFDLAGAMQADGLAAATRPGAADRLAVTQGLSGEIRPLVDDPALPGEAVRWLQGREEIGLVFVRDDLTGSLPGTLPLSAVRLDHPRAAPVFYAMRSDDGPDPYGLPGRGLMSGNGVPVGGGMHGGLNPRELSTVLRIAGPGLPRGLVDGRPAALPDVAPTVLDLMGLAFEGAGGTSLLDGLGTEDGGATTVERIEARHGAFAQELIWRRRGARFALEAGRRIPATAAGG